MEALGLSGLLFFLATLAPAEAAKAPQVGVENLYQHRLRLDVRMRGPSGLEPVLSALADIAATALETPGFSLVDSTYLPQPGEYHIELELVVISDKRSLEPAFEVGLRWVAHVWCDKMERHTLKVGPLVKTTTTQVRLLPTAGKLIKQETAIIRSGILELDRRFVENLRRSTTEM